MSATPLSCHHRWIAVLLAAAALMLATAVVPNPGGGARPLAALALSVDPASGPAGGSVRLFGTGWIPSPNAAPYQIHWGSKGGTSLGTFAPNANGAFSVNITIPSSASEGNHTIYACQNCNGKATWASTVYDVERSATPTPLRPTPTPTPTRVPTECDRSGMSGEYLIDFEGLAAGTRLNGTTLPPGVRFLGDDDLLVVRPAVEARSGSQALMNDFGGREFGSVNTPIRIGLDNLADFVGVYAGLNDSPWATEAFTATLTAYGLDADGRRIVVASDSDSLGPDETPIEVCLAVSAPGQIFEVTLSYGEAVEAELIDDLVIRGPETPVPVPFDDRPPIVTIDHPIDGEAYEGPSVRLDGTVIEDRELERLVVWLNGSDYQDLGFTRLDESRYAFFLDGIPAADLIDCGLNHLAVRAYDANGSTSDSVRFTFRNGDLEVIDAEPVQVLYDAPLIVGKATAFRVRVNSTFACEVEADFRLGLPDGEWDLGMPDAPGWALPDISGPVPIPGNASEYEVMLPHVTDAGAAWDPVANPFGKAGLIRAAPRPADELVTFTVDVDPADELHEAAEDNNRYESLYHHAYTTRGIHVVFVGQVWNHERFDQGLQAEVTRGDVSAPRFASEGQFLDRLPDYAAEQMDYLIGTYPVADAKVTWEVFNGMYHREDFRESYLGNPACWDSSANKEKGCNACFSNMMSSMFQGDESTSMTHAVALVQPYGCCGCNGAGIAVYIEDDEGIDGNLVHELGHQDIGAGDCYLCTGADGTCGCGDCGRLSCESCFADEGFWVNHWQPYEGSARYYMWCVANPADIWTRMDPCATTSGGEARAGYIAMAEALLDEADPPAVVVRGMLTRTDEAEFAPFLRVDQAVVDLQPDATGTHAIVYVDAAGQALASHGFTPVFTRYLPEPEGAIETDTYLFSFRVAWKEGIAAIELRDGAGRVLASRPVSASAPAVELQAPNGGEQWRQGSRQTVRWKGTDPDGDDLTYALWISDNGGESWQPLAIDIAQPSYAVDTTGFPPGDAYRIKVRVTDGVNTGVDESEASFAVYELSAGPSPILILAGVGVAVLIGVALLVTAFRTRKPKARKA